MHSSSLCFSGKPNSCMPVCDRPIKCNEVRIRKENNVYWIYCDFQTILQNICVARRIRWCSKPDLHTPEFDKWTSGHCINNQQKHGRIAWHGTKHMLLLSMVWLHQVMKRCTVQLRPTLHAMWRVTSWRDLTTLQDWERRVTSQKSLLFKEVQPRGPMLWAHR